MSFLGNMFGANASRQAGTYQDTVNATPQMVSGSNIAATNTTNQNVALDPALQAQQAAFVNALQGQVAGTGPNPAQAMLAQNTGANVANQAALMAGQRGAGANVGLMARQAGQQGANTQQQAVGQGATMQAQQSLGAMGQLGGQLNQMQGQNVNVQQLNQAANMQSQLANQAANLEAQKANQANALGAAETNQAANLNAQLGSAQLNAQMANTSAQQNGQIAGGLMSGVSALGAALPGLLAQGGMVKQQYAGGGLTSLGSPLPLSLSDNSGVGGSDTLQKGISSGLSSLGKGIQGAIKKMGGPKSDTANIMSGGVPSDNAWASFTGAPGTKTSSGAPTDQATYDMYQSMQNPTGNETQPIESSPSPDMSGNLERGIDTDSANPGLAHGGKVPAKVSPGEVYLPPSKVKEVKAKGKDPIKTGEKIKGKAKVPGATDSYANDTVNKTLHEGGIVIPRSITQGDDPSGKAKAFIDAVLAHQNIRKRQ